MEILFSIIPLVIIIILLLIKKVSFKKIINSVFFSILSMIITIIIGSIMTAILGGISTIQLATTEISLASFFTSLFTAAFPEEISKFLSIKLNGAKNKNDIFINSIIVGITYAAIENMGYISSHGINIGLTRMLQPGHLFFQIIMAFFLSKALNNQGYKKILYNGLGIALPMLCHASFNTFVSNNIIGYIFYAVGILTYIFTFYYILKLPSTSGQTKIKFFSLKLTFVIITTLFMLFINLFIHSQVNSNLNTIQKIKEDNIELKIISSEKVKITNEVYSGNYIKVKVEIKNNNDTTFIVDNIRIVDNFNKNDSYLSLWSFHDSLSEISAKETSAGYLYFEDDGYNYSYLIYTAGEFPDRQTYTFNIK